MIQRIQANQSSTRPWRRLRALPRADGFGARNQRFGDGCGLGGGAADLHQGLEDKGNVGPQDNRFKGDLRPPPDMSATILLPFWFRW